MFTTIIYFKILLPRIHQTLPMIKNSSISIVGKYYKNKIANIQPRQSIKRAMIPIVCNHHKIESAKIQSI